jgi:DNA-3-methyladenine glycosylase II
VKPDYWDTATRLLSRRDSVLKGLIAAYPGIHMARRGDPFTTLARAIVGQQISVKAAQSIWNRFVAATGGGTC